MVNGHRAWSDERGLQSLQILAYLSAAANLTGPQPWIMDAYHELTNATNQYNQNLLNLKITVPLDDNYSDDELTFLPCVSCMTTFARIYLALPVELPRTQPP